MKAIIVLSILLALTGCANPVQYATNKCADQGVRPGSSQYQACVQHYYNARMQMARALSNIRIDPPRRPINTNCTQVGNRTSCTTW